MFLDEIINGIRGVAWVKSKPLSPFYVRIDDYFFVVVGRLLIKRRWNSILYVSVLFSLLSFLFFRTCKLCGLVFFCGA